MYIQDLDTSIIIINKKNYAILIEEQEGGSSMYKDYKYGLFFVILLIANSFIRNTPIDYILILAVFYFFIVSYLYNSISKKKVFFLINTIIIELFLVLQNLSTENIFGTLFLGILFSLLIFFIFYIVIDKNKKEEQE